MGNNPINKKTTALRVNAAYSVPTADGTADQLMKTDGAGTLGWVSSSLVGNLVQTVYTSTTAMVTVNTNGVIDDSIPQVSEGTAILSLAITPKSASNILNIRFTTFATPAAGSGATSICSLYQDAGANALSASIQTFVNANVTQVQLEHNMVAGTTSATTFKINLSTQSGLNIYVNGSAAGGRYMGGVASTTLTITEYKP